ncbi:hypothetical protein PLICRDRAFT_36824 [Plicaturopsis crispa FD-325 SS-3]|nr:hypothetical protein PLICRDRAFT_36824 [Plicaturopsis crispa FD-325 SS-3]
MPPFVAPERVFHPKARRLKCVPPLAAAVKSYGKSTRISPCGSLQASRGEDMCDNSNGISTPALCPATPVLSAPVRPQRCTDVPTADIAVLCGEKNHAPPPYPRHPRHTAPADSRYLVHRRHPHARLLHNVARPLPRLSTLGSDATVRPRQLCVNLHGGARPTRLSNPQPPRYVFVHPRQHRACLPRHVCAYVAYLRQQIANRQWFCAHTHIPTGSCILAPAEARPRPPERAHDGRTIYPLAVRPCPFFPHCVILY